jgi:hypothetical protein
MMIFMNAYDVMIQKIVRNAIYTIRRRGMECEPEQIEPMEYNAIPMGNGMEYHGFLKTKDAYMFKDLLALELTVQYIAYQKKHDDDRINEPRVSLRKDGLEILFYTQGG